MTSGPGCVQTKESLVPNLFESVLEWEYVHRLSAHKIIEGRCLNPAYAVFGGTMQGLENFKIFRAEQQCLCVDIAEQKLICRNGVARRG